MVFTFTFTVISPENVISCPISMQSGGYCAITVLLTKRNYQHNSLYQFIEPPSKVFDLRFVAEGQV